MDSTFTDHINYTFSTWLYILLVLLLLVLIIIYLRDLKKQESKNKSDKEKKQIDTTTKEEITSFKGNLPPVSSIAVTEAKDEFLLGNTEIKANKPNDKVGSSISIAEPITNENFIYRVSYTPSIAAQNDYYPIFCFPKNDTVVRSYRVGGTKRRGFKEGPFQTAIEQAFGKSFFVYGNLRINTGGETRPYEPDIAMVYQEDEGLRIDIEIDEPYSGITRQPTHCKGEDTMRDIYFVDRGWVVLRFSEYQVHTKENACLRFIAKIVHSIIPSFQIPVAIADYEIIENEKTWDIVQAQKWERVKYREQYLNHEFSIVEEREETSERGLNEQELNEETLVKPTLIGVSDDRPLIGFNLKNIHSRDRRIVFYPEPHIYTIDNIPIPSASTVISKFFPEFDSEYYSNKKAIQLGLSANEVAARWIKEGRDAAQAGTLLHEQIEKYYLNQEIFQTKEFRLFQQFTEDHNGLKPYRSEWRIFDEEYHIAGTIDLVTHNGGYHNIYDWKRSKKVVNPYTSEPISKNPWQSGVGQLSDIDDTSYNRYCLQQSLYKYILEKNYNIEISKMYLIVLYPDYDRYYKLEVPYQKDQIEFILKSL